MQLGDAVGALGEPEAHHGHVEDRGVAALVVLGAEGEDPVDRDAGHRRGAAEVLLDQLAREPVDAGRHRGVGREDGRAAADLERGVEVEPGAVLGHRELADPLQAEEAGVALVGVEHLGLGRAGDPAEGAERADTADAEQELLVQPVLAGAAVQPVGHLAEVVGVLLDVGVEQQQRHPADIGDPDPGDHLGATGQRDPDQRTGAVGLVEQRDRQLVGVQDGVGLLLPALTRERLLEVALLVEQADADDRDAEVGGRLEVVAGEDAEAAGVLRQHRADAVLRGEVRDRARAVTRRGLVPTVAGQVAVEVGLRRLEHVEERRVGGELLEPAGIDRAEQVDRVVPGRLPELGVDGREDVLRGRVPGPAEVAREGAEGGQRRRQDGTDGESSDGSHPWRLAAKYERSNPLSAWRGGTSRASPHSRPRPQPLRHRRSTTPTARPRPTGARTVHAAELRVYERAWAGRGLDGSPLGDLPRPPPRPTPDVPELPRTSTTGRPPVVEVSKAPWRSQPRNPRAPAPDATLTRSDPGLRRGQHFASVEQWSDASPS